MTTNRRPSAWLLSQSKRKMTQPHFVQVFSDPTMALMPALKKNSWLTIRRISGPRALIKLFSYSTVFSLQRFYELLMQWILLKSNSCMVCPYLTFNRRSVPMNSKVLTCWSEKQIRIVGSKAVSNAQRADVSCSDRAHCLIVPSPRRCGQQGSHGCSRRSRVSVSQQS